MTDRRPTPADPATARRPARSPGAAAIAWGGSGLAFMAVLGVLAWQVAAGADPAIGEQAAAPPPAERIVVRRIVRRVVVTHAAPAAPAAERSGAALSAPAAGAPAPAAPSAPAPAPAPAPPTTRSS